MSEAFRKSMLNRLPAMPPTQAPWAGQNEGTEEGIEELEGGDSMGELTAALPSSSKVPHTELSPLSASGFFDQALEVNPSGNDTTFRVYLTLPSLSTQTSASPSHPSEALENVGNGGNGAKGKGKETYLICHHGGGASGLSFAPLAKSITERSGGELGVIAYDCRGHGKTRSEGGQERDRDLSLSTLLSDLLGIIRHLFPDPTQAPSFLLLGHSMGAAPILSTSPILQQKGYKVPGVIVLDVVEGTAIEALPLMKSIIANRPTSFRSVVDAIHWHLTSNSIRNTESARVSVPSFVVPSPETTDPGGPQTRQVWRTDLVATAPYWEEWYAGLSSRFLSAKCARLLVLAGQERLDRELMVGQMQGKFQLEVMPEVGHYLHEDNPESLAATLVTFWRRNTQILVLPPKIGSTGSVGVEVKRVGED